MSVVKIASGAACRSTAAATASGRIRSSGLSKTARTRPTMDLSWCGSSSDCWRPCHSSYADTAASRCPLSDRADSSARSARRVVADVADEGVGDRGTPADVRLAGVELDDRLPGRVPVAVGEVGADQEQHVAVVDRLRGGRVADQAGLADLVRVVVLEALLGLEGEHHRRLQRLGQRQHLVARLPGADADQQRDRPGVIQHLAAVAIWSSGAAPAPGRRERRGPRVLRQVLVAEVAGQGQHGDALLRVRRVDRLLQHQRQLRRVT